ncbi:MAG TPA: flagellar motor switch protein FliG [Burkholderiaceae bacterium]|nr:flagellar motor switch protein FliG [Burkholderiaceae bacterium]
MSDPAAASEDSGIERSAILLMRLGEEAAAEVFRHLSPKEVQRIGEAMARLRTVPRDRIDQVLTQFKSEAERYGTLVPDAGEYVRSVLKRALGEQKAGLLIQRIMQDGDVSGIESLKWMDAESVAELVRNEHPQIVASILVHLDPTHAAEIVGRLGESMRADVVRRIATLDGIQPSALAELDQVLSRLLDGADRRRKSRPGGPKVAADILNRIGGAIESQVLDALRTADEQLAQAIEERMFTFEDLARIDDRAMQGLLREVASDSLVIALKGAPAELREKVLKNMSQRAAEALREDLESRGPVRVAEVEAQQREILRTARRLAESGEIVLGGSGEDAFV